MFVSAGHVRIKFVPCTYVPVMCHHMLVEVVCLSVGRHGCPTCLVLLLSEVVLNHLPLVPLVVR